MPNNSNISNYGQKIQKPTKLNNNYNNNNNNNNNNITIMHSSPNWMVPWDTLLDLENANNISDGNPQERGFNMGYETED